MKVVLIAAVTLDGYIARSATEPAMWTSKEDKKFFVKKTKECGTIIIGRTTWETIRRPLPERRIIVLTHGTGVEEVPGAVECMHGTPAEVLAGLAAQGVEQVALAGGGKVYTEYLNAGVVDEVWLTTEAILFGQGVKLVDGLASDIRFERIHEEVLGPSATLAGYRLVPASS